jgi:4-amino-4-deoxy-L-arabinose transferase-like glycosyltransferase
MNITRLRSRACWPPVGVNGLALALPNAVAGVLSILLVYLLVRRPFGSLAALAAALALAVMPVAIATERNNTIDGMLVFVLLLAAWAFLQSVYTGKVRWLFLGAFLVGLGFNIKMLQAYMPLPAFYAIYFFGSKNKWTRKVLHLGAATLLLLLVSFSWALAVILTPAADRPYVDSTSGNSVMELIFGHNGIERLTSSRGGGINPGANPLQVGVMNGTFPQPSGGGNFTPGNPPLLPNVQAFSPPASGNEGRFSLMNYASQPGGRPGGSMDFGSAGTLRLFTEPLSGEASWLLPFVLGSLLASTFAFWKHPFGEGQLSIILWAGWLLPEIIYFTYSQGLMHAYYLIMLGPPIAALAAITIRELWRIVQKRPLMGWGLTVLLVAGTLVFEAYTLLGTTSLDILAIEIAGILFSAGIVLAANGRLKARIQATALSLMFAAMLIAPSIWSGLTTFNTSPAGLPAAGPTGHPGLATGNIRTRTADGGNLMILPANLTEDNSMESRAPGGPGNGVDQNLLNYLLANTQPGTYLMATGDANSAAPYILATGRPVLTLGGFLDQYDEVSVEKLASLIRDKELRFVLGESLDRHQEIGQYVRQNCKAVDSAAYSGASVTVGGNPRGPSSNTNLCDCGG